MKKTSLIFWIILIAGCFLIVLYFAFNVTRTVDREVQEIHTSSEKALGDYLKVSAIPTVIYPSNPLFYDKNECILICFVITENIGVKYRTQFNILLSRGSRIWKANIVKVNRKRYIPPENKKAPWEFFFKSEKRNGNSK